jgi:hypothetical protein
MWNWLAANWYEPAPDKRLHIVDFDVGGCRRATNISNLIELGDKTTRTE